MRLLAVLVAGAGGVVDGVSLQIAAAFFAIPVIIAALIAWTIGCRINQSHNQSVNQSIKSLKPRL